VPTNSDWAYRQAEKIKKESEMNAFFILKVFLMHGFIISGFDRKSIKNYSIRKISLGDIYILINFAKLCKGKGHKVGSRFP
jgi:hypothetical protein